MIIYNVSDVKSILLTYSMEIFLLKLRPNVDMILKRVVILNEERNQYKMKMIFISLLTVAVLAGCSETAEETPRTNSPDETTAVTQSTSDTSDSETATEEDFSESEAESPNEKYKELTIQDYFNPEDFETHLVTDNPDSRVFIFSERDQPAYKTVYIKPDSRLKIINLTTHELLMNERI